MHGVHRWVHVRGKCVSESKLTIIYCVAMCVRAFVWAENIRQSLQNSEEPARK